MNQLRTPQGQPTGGEFASHNRAEAEVALDDDRSPRAALESAKTDAYRANMRMLRLAVAAIGDAGRELAPGAKKIRVTYNVDFEGDSLSFDGVVDENGDDIDLDNHDELSDIVDDIGYSFTDADELGSAGVESAGDDYDDDGLNSVYYITIPTEAVRTRTEIDDELAMLAAATANLEARRAAVTAEATLREALDDPAE